MTVHRRHVFFLSGFDPKGASYYHGLYRKESAQQGAVTGVHYEVGPRVRRDNGNTTWQVHTEADGRTTETTFEFVRWDDIVRAHWPRTAWQILLGSLRGYRAWVATLIALAFPAGFWLVALLLGAGLGLAIAGLLTPVLPAAVAWPIAAVATLATWWGAVALEKRWNTSWLLRIFQFADDWRAGRAPALQDRLQPMADDVIERMKDPEVDEVLVVGFSVGSLLAASVAARVQQRALRDGIDLDRLSMMTLGHCIPLLGLMTGAEAFRAELDALGRSPQVRWVDFSSVTDWGAFALVDPLSMCLAGGDRPYAPRMASPRFHLMFEPALYARLVRNKPRMHLQYLMAGQRPVFYDYFAITAGPMSMADRMDRLQAQ
jgi:hypothetical protein